MVNGNDILEHEEANYQRLQEDFLRQYTLKDFKRFILGDEGTFEAFKAFWGSDWDDFVLEDYSLKGT